MSTYRCPHCGSLLALPEPQNEYHTTRLPWLKQGVLESFDFDAHQQFGGRQEHATALPVMALAPGERHEQRSYRRWDLGDIRTYLGLAGATGLALGAASLATWGAFQVAWAWPFAVAFDAVAGVWMMFVYRAFDDDKAIESVNEHERYHESAPMPPQQQPQLSPYHVTGDITDHNGRQHLIDIVVDPVAWYELCKAVIRGRRFSGREATKRGIQPEEWERIVDHFWSHRWLDSKGYDRANPRLNPDGMDVVRMYATTPPLDAEPL